MWTNKLNIKVIDEKDGSGGIVVEWDETDSDLDYWNNLGKEGQEEFIMKALYNALEKTGVTTNDN